MNDKEYWEIRDKIVREMGTIDIINLVIDLIGNLKDLKKEILEDYPIIKEDYNRLENVLKEMERGLK